MYNTQKAGGHCSIVVRDLGL
uniref:Uncharacterized protein n=1 Tax=Anguilla anguilla TaxID=7936 RepID=A0A0E9RD26_ANGAN